MKNRTLFAASATAMLAALLWFATGSQSLQVDTPIRPDPAIAPPRASPTTAGDDIAPERTTAETRLTLHVTTNTPNGLVQAPECRVTATIYLGAEDDGVRGIDAPHPAPRTVDTLTDQGGLARIDLPNGTMGATFEVSQQTSLAARGTWQPGQPTKISVVLTPSTDVTVLVHGRLNAPASVWVSAATGDARMRVPMLEPATVIPRVPVHWSPIAVSVRTVDGAEHRAHQAIWLEQGRPSTVEITVLDATGSLRGKLVDEAGNPIQAASVLVTPSRRNGAFESAEVSTGTSGDFSFSGLPLSRLRLRVSPPSHARFDHHADLTTTPSLDLGRIIAPSGSAITGVVAAPSVGKLLLGGVMPGNTSTFGMHYSPLSGLRTGIPPSGRFTIPHLAPGPYLVWVATGSDLRRDSWAGRVVELGTEPLEVANLQVGGGPVWTGRLLGNGSRPWPEGSRCLAMGTTDSWWTSAPIASDGTVTLETGQGDWLIGIESESYSRWLGAIPAGTTASEVVEPMASARLVCSSTIRSDLALELEWMDAPGVRAPAAANCFVEPSGRTSHSWILRSLAAGSYRLFAHAGTRSFEPIQFRVAAGDGLLVEWPADWQ